MSQRPDAEQVAVALQVSIGLLKRQLRQAQAEGELTAPETSALARLDRAGPASASALARLEQISPQSIGATLAALERRGLVKRAVDPGDRRRVVLSLTDPGRQTLRHTRNAQVQQLARAVAVGFTRAELEQLLAVAPLIERLAQRL